MGKQLRNIAILLLCWSWLVAPTTTASASEDIQSHLYQRLSRDGHLATMRIAGERLRTLRVIKQFYEQRGYRPAWSRVAGPSLLADALIESLSMLEQEGLDPHDYHLRALEGLVSAARHLPSVNRAAQLAELELLLSDAFLSAALHLSAGRLQSVERGSKPHHLDAEMVSHLERAVAERTLAHTLASLVPTSSIYTDLRQALAQYREIAANDG